MTAPQPLNNPTHKALREALQVVLDKYCDNPNDYSTPEAREAANKYYLDDEKALDAILKTIAEALPEEQKMPKYGNFYDPEWTETRGYNTYYREARKILVIIP